MAETVVVKPVNPSLKLAKDWGWLLAILLVVAQQYGWLTADQIATIKRAIPVESKDEKIAVEPKSIEKPEDFQQWADLIRKVIEEIKSKPAPVDTDPVDPKPEPEPRPVEPITPLPTDSRIVITDETGKPVTAATVDAGALFLATAHGGSSIGWQVSKHGTVRIAALPGTLGYAFSLDAGAWVECFLTDYGAKTQTSIRITCNSGPRPPPVVPDVEPLPPTGRKLSLAVLYEPNKISPSTAIVLNATEAAWNQFTSSGHEWIFYDIKTTEPLGVKAKADAAGATMPTLCIYEKTTRSKLGVIPLPTSVDELRAVVRMYEGGAK
jgi:hypothetical protein